MLRFLLLAVSLGTACALTCQLRRYEKRLTGYKREGTGPEQNCTGEKYCMMIKYGQGFTRDIYIGCSRARTGNCEYYFDGHEQHWEKKDAKKPICFTEYPRVVEDKKGQVIGTTLKPLKNGKTVCCCTHNCFAESTKNAKSGSDAAKQLEEIITDYKRHINPFVVEAELPVPQPAVNGGLRRMGPGVGFLLMVCAVMKSLCDRM